MRDRDVYAKLLGLVPPWEVVDVELDPKGRLVKVMLAHRSDAKADVS